MIEQQTVWTPRARSTTRTPLRPKSASRFSGGAQRISGMDAYHALRLPRLHPLTWLEALARSAPVAIATTLMSLAILLYLLQANRVSVLEFNLTQLQQQRAQLLDTNAQLHIQVAKLQAVERVEALATTRLHMAKWNVNHTIWLNIRVPAASPAASPPPIHVPTGPFAWMRETLRAIWQTL
jgi:cell division protein FtsL